jgi:hypothetical protein
MKERKESLPPQLAEQLTMMVTQQLQFQRTIWLMAKEAGGVMTIDEAEMNPLWQIKYHRPEGSQTRLTIKAETMPEPTDDQIRVLAAALLGKQKALHEEAGAIGLGVYPSAYIIARLAPIAVNHNGKWYSKEDYDALSKSN